MPSDQSVTFWIEQLKAGDPQASQQLWERYFSRLVRLARHKLQSMPRRVVDEEDVALSAFHSFLGGVEKGRFPQLNDRNDLWQILVALAGWKASNQRKHMQALKRGGGNVRGESVFHKMDETEGDRGIAQVIDDEPTPEFALMVADEYAHLMDLLGDDTLRQVAEYKMQGYSNDEIAGEMNCATRTVERKLQGIRAIWSQEKEN